ncbi:head maturation protease [Pseudomonas phage WP1]
MAFSNLPAGQLGLPGDPMRTVNVYRPEPAVHDPEYIESLKNLPLIDEHEMLSGFDGDDDGMAPEDKGVEGIITANAYYEAPMGSRRYPYLFPRQSSIGWKGARKTCP